MRNIKYISLIFISIFIFFKLTQAGSLVFLPKTILVLPEDSNVRLNWLVLPDNEIKNFKQKQGNLKFFVDFNNRPNVLYAHSILINLSTGYLVVFNTPITEVISLDNGAIIISDNESMGYLEIVKSKSDLPQAKLKEIAKLPFSQAKIFKGENTIYSTTYNPHSRMYEIYLFDPLKRQFRIILTLSEPISALTGIDEHLFFANGRFVKEYSKGKINFLYEDPNYEIKELTYNSKAGLIYKTDRAVGYIKDGHAFEFLKAQNVQIFLKGTSLYVFFESLLGVLEMANIDNLKRYNYKVERIIEIQQLFQNGGK